MGSHEQPRTTTNSHEQHEHQQTATSHNVHSPQGSWTEQCPLSGAHSSYLAVPIGKFSGSFFVGTSRWHYLVALSWHFSWGFSWHFSGHFSGISVCTLVGTLGTLVGRPVGTCVTIGYISCCFAAVDRQLRIHKK
jgi:hypothetical protein